jgi:hypothetical protein
MRTYLICLLWLASASAEDAPRWQWEAEQLNAVGAEPETRFAAEASGGAYVLLTKGDKQNPAQKASRLSATFSAKPGNYILRVRALAVNRGSDSFFYWVDDSAAHSISAPPESRWSWQHRPFLLAVGGEHTIHVAAREPIRIDAIEIQQTGARRTQIRQSQPFVPEPNKLWPITVNPPTFRWLGDWRAPYTIQLSCTADFRQPTTFQDVHQTFFRPRQPLEPGTWYWRYRQGAKKWSAPTEFVVPKDAAKWPIPSWETLLARLPASHPRLWMRPEDVPSLKSKLQGLLKQPFAAWCKAAQRNVGKKLALENPPKAERTSDHRARTILQVSSKMAAIHMMRPAGELAFLAMMTGRDDFAQEAKRRALIAARLDPKGYTSHGVSDFANGSVVANLGRVYDYLYDKLSAEERTLIRKAILARIGHYMPSLEQRLYSAHGWQYVIQDLTAGALAVYDEDAGARDWLAWSMKMFVSLYPWWGGADGGSAECVSYYTGTDMLTSLATDSFWRAAAGLDFAKNNPWYKADAWFPIYGHPISGPRSEFGDHGVGARPPSVHQAFASLRMADLYNNGYAASYADAILASAPAGSLDRVAFKGLTGVLAALWMPFGNVERKPLSELPAGRAFYDVGFVYLHSNIASRTDNVFFELRSSPYGSFGHAHADQNSFNVQAYGEPLIVDSGYYTSYGDKHHYGWTVTTQAHNTILVDGKGQPTRNLDAWGRIAKFDQTADWAYIQGDATAAYRDPELRRFLRNVLWRRGERVQTYVIYDDIEAKDGQPHRYDWLLHAGQEMQIDEHAQVVTVFNSKAAGRVTFLSPQDLAFTKSHHFNPPPEKWRPDRQNANYPDQWHLKITPKTERPAEKFVVVIQVCRRGHLTELPAVPQVEIIDGRPQLK